MKHSLLLPAMLALAALGTNAHAAIYTVGSGSDCTHATIQAAITTTNSHPGADTIRLTRSMAYEPAAVTLTTSEDLDIVGGFATCAQTSSDSVYTVVSGQGSGSSAVFAITANGSAIVKLRQLDIKNGSSYGVHFSGNGILQTIDTTIERNGFGGIHATTTGNSAELVIDSGTLIASNGTSQCFLGQIPHGGGISLEGPIEMTMTAPQSMLTLNSACLGGGLYVGSGAYAYVGSAGYSGLPPIYLNSSEEDGGGAYVQGTLKLFAADPTQPGRVNNNEAARNGGGIYVTGSNSRLCGWDFAVDDNTAQGLGGAIHGDSGSTIVLNRDDNALCTPHPEAKRCAMGTTCNSISGNVAQGDGGIVELNAGLLDSKRVRMRGNQAAFAIHGLDSDVRLNACLIADNTLSKRVLDTYGSATANSLFVDSCTLAHNTVGEVVIYATRESWLTNNIIDQPSNLVADLSTAPGMSYAANLLVTSTGGLPTANSIVLGDPKFVDAAHGDYHLSLASPAIDFTAADTFFSDSDLDGDPRNVDLPDVPNRYGPRDLGAYEWNPLIRNGWFDAGLSSWTLVGGAWDGTQNAAGNAGSGSWKMQYDVTPPNGRQQSGPGDYAVGEQCVRLPAAGSYLLNGWGKGGGNMLFHDSAVLTWEYRKNGGADCSGTADATGDITLGSSASWTHPAQAATIDVPAADFHANGTTLKVRLLMRTTWTQGVSTVWFDGLTLERSDVIFKNGFD